MKLEEKLSAETNVFSKVNGYCGGSRKDLETRDKVRLPEPKQGAIYESLGRPPAPVVPRLMLPPPPRGPKTKLKPPPIPKTPKSILKTENIRTVNIKQPLSSLFFTAGAIHWPVSTESEIAMSSTRPGTMLKCTKFSSEPCSSAAANIQEWKAIPCASTNLPDFRKKCRRQTAISHSISSSYNLATFSPPMSSISRYINYTQKYEQDSVTVELSSLTADTMLTESPPLSNTHTLSSAATTARLPDLFNLTYRSSTLTQPLRSLDKSTPASISSASNSWNSSAMPGRPPLPSIPSAKITDLPYSRLIHIPYQSPTEPTSPRWHHIDLPRTTSSGFKIKRSPDLEPISRIEYPMKVISSPEEYKSTTTTADAQILVDNHFEIPSMDTSRKRKPSYISRNRGGGGGRVGGAEQRDYIGFATLPEQVHRKSVKRGFDFTLMVVGESGLGKSTLVNSLFLGDLYKNRKVPEVQERIEKTTSIERKSMEIEERGVRLRLTVVDTPGFGDAINCEDSWRVCSSYIDDQFRQYFTDESGLNRRNIQDNRVHCCLYFVPPYGHSIRQMDLDMMRRLHRKVNIVVVIAKADTLTTAEVHRLKKRILKDLEDNQIQVYQFPECDSDEDEEFKQQDRELKAAAPFAVVGSNTTLEVAGKRVRGRQYPWGVVDVENPKHSDFVKLRTMLISTHMQDLKDVTQDVHYENFRAQCISQISQHALRERGKLKRDSIGSNFDTNTITDTDRLLLQKDEEIRRMQDMLTQMQEKLKASDKKHDSVIDV